MPKRVKKAATPPRVRARDVNQTAHSIVRQATEASDEGFKAQLSEYMSGLGAKGGKVSGARRMTNLSAEKRKEIARLAAQARWAKKA